MLKTKWIMEGDWLVNIMHQIKSIIVISNRNYIKGFYDVIYFSLLSSLNVAIDYNDIYRTWSVHYVKHNQ